MTPRAQGVLKGTTCGLVVLAIDWVYFDIFRVNNTTVALTFLLLVLVVSAGWGLGFAIPTSIVAAMSFNFFFLPPIGTFTIADPQNWVALGSFFFTAVLSSQISERMRRKAHEADERRREMERLYAFSQRLMVSGNVIDLLRSVPRHVVESFGLESAALFSLERGDIYRSNPNVADLPADDLKTVAAVGDLRMDAAHRASFVPVRMGVRVLGALGLRGAPPSPQTLEALGGLVAVATERAAAVERLGRAEGARESERLRGALLDSVTHEFRTPLTGIKASITSLRSGLALSPDQREDLLAVIEEETDRLNRLVGEAVEMAQLDAHQVKLELAPESMRAAVDAAVRESAGLLADHPVEVRLPDQAPRVLMDLAWIKKVLVHLLENAAKYSLPGTPIFVSAEVKGNRLVTSVADRGAGIDDLERSMVFDKFYRGQSQRYRVQGTGMGLAIVKAIVEAHGGHISVTSQLAQGSVFSFDLPVAP
jgi:two-component system sensor histidine kinase KdpD